MDIQRFRELLANAIGTDRYELWFGESQALQFVDGQLVVTSDRFSLERVRTQFGAILGQLVQTASGGKATIRYAPRPEATALAAAAGGEDARQGVPGRLSVSRLSQIAPTVASVARVRSAGRPPACRGLVFGAENRLAETALQQVLAAPGTLSPLFLQGPVGCGKSAILTAIASAPLGPTSARRRVVVSAEQFTTLFVEALKGRGLPSFRQKFREIDLLAIDDLQFFQNKQATLVELKYTLDHLTHKKKQIVLAADRPPAELGFLEPELLNRLGSGLVCPLYYPDNATRLGILRTMCSEHAVEVAPAILAAIAQRVTGDIRQLRGAIIRLKAAALSGVPLTEWNRVEPYLADLVAAQHKSVSWSAIEQAVCAVCGVSEADLKSPKRSEQVNVARNLAMWLSRKHIGVAFSDIGRHYGGRSHSTVISANKKVSQWLQAGEAVRVGPRGEFPVSQAMREIEAKLKIG